MSDVRKLIADARKWQELFTAPIHRNIVKRLADALEATLQPVDVDALAKVVDRAIIFPSEQAGLSNQERWEIRDEAARAVVAYLKGENGALD